MRRLHLSLVPLIAALGFMAAAPAASQTLADYDYENLRFRGLGVDLGYMWADKVTDTQLYSLRLDLGYLGPGVRIIPSISYWRSEFTDSELDDLATRLNQATGSFISGDDLGLITWSDLSLSVDGHYVWNTPLNVLTFVGVGGSLHALNGQGDAIDDTFVEDLLDNITAGVAALAGAEYQPVDRVRVYGEGRYTIMNSIQYLSARVGLQFMFQQDDAVEIGSALPAPPAPAPAP